MPLSTSSSFFPSRVQATSSNQEEISLSAILSRLVEIVSESAYYSHHISHAVFKLHHETHREATKNQAQLLRAWESTALKTLASFVHIAEAGFQLSWAKPFLSLITGRPETDKGLTKIVSTISQLFTGITNTSATLLDNQNSAERTEEGSRSEISRSSSEQATRKKGDAEGSFNELLRLIESIQDAKRNTMASMHR